MAKEDRMLIVYCVCGYGCGTSLVLKMSLEDVFSAVGIDADITPCDITSASNLNADIIYTSNEFYSQVVEQNPEVKVVAITDYLNKDELNKTAVPAAKEILENE